MRRALFWIVLAGCTRPPTPTKAELARGHAEVARLRAAATAWHQAQHRCPTLAGLTAADRHLPTQDPWRHDYVLLCPGQNGHAVDVVSPGPDGQLATEDDLRSWDAR